MRVVRAVPTRGAPRERRSVAGAAACPAWWPWAAPAQNPLHHPTTRRPPAARCTSYPGTPWMGSSYSWIKGKYLFVFVSYLFNVRINVLFYHKLTITRNIFISRVAWSPEQFTGIDLVMSLLVSKPRCGVFLCVLCHIRYQITYKFIIFLGIVGPPLRIFFCYIILPRFESTAKCL